MSSNTIQFPDLDSPTLDSRSEINKVVCLGKEFTSEEDRREYFRNELRTKLPELKKIEGFPIGEDEDIITLSDPPYYTACPNPWLNDFIAEWEKEKGSILVRQKDFQVKEPYAADVSEGKNNPIYTAHTYHTKVPHPAIMRYLLHYTQPGDIILDAFAGTGMTGLAGQLCNDPDIEFKYKVERDWMNERNELPVWGIRKVICSDLSPVATLISHNFNAEIDFNQLDKSFKQVYNKLIEDYSWMYETKHADTGIGKISFVLWSEIFSCSFCNHEIEFWTYGVDHESGKVKDEFNCPKCKSMLKKANLERLWVSRIDKVTGEIIKESKFIPVVIVYSYKKKSYKKRPDDFDLKNFEKIENEKISEWYPTDLLPNGVNTVQPINSNGFIRVSQFYTKRNLVALSSIFQTLIEQPGLSFLATSIIMRSTNMNRLVVNYFFNGGGGANGAHLKGTLYVSSLPTETSVIEQIKNKYDGYLRTFKNLKRISGNTISSTQSAISLKQIHDNSVDFIFTDPPFGGNIMYSELNFIWESWLKVKTNNKTEAIENKIQGKSILDYQTLMTKCFEEYYRVLKPGRWMTVEFSNTSAAVWNGIQTALQRAGFIIANVAGLDKKQGSFKAVTTPTAVKQDLIISCYKQSEEFESKFKTIQGEIAIWDFVSEHLHHLPVHIKRESNTSAIVERNPKILFDRLITFYLMNDLPVPIDAKDFQVGLKQRFIERDGMFFTAEQVAEYDEKKAMTPQFLQMSWIVSNESDAIEWLKDKLRMEPQKYQDIMPTFRIAAQSLRKGDTLPELQDILNESFIQESDGNWRTPDPYEAKDREVLRTKVLLKEFNGYITVISQPKAKKMKEVRVEALRAGFKNCWEQKDFKTIVFLGDKIPQNILLEDEQLLMYYDIAKDRV